MAPVASRCVVRRVPLASLARPAVVIRTNDRSARSVSLRGAACPDRCALGTRRCNSIERPRRLWRSMVCCLFVAGIARTARTLQAFSLTAKTTTIRVSTVVEPRRVACGATRLRSVGLWRLPLSHCRPLISQRRCMRCPIRPRTGRQSRPRQRQRQSPVTGRPNRTTSPVTGRRGRAGKESQGLARRKRRGGPASSGGAPHLRKRDKPCSRSATRTRKA